MNSPRRTSETLGVTCAEAPAEMPINAANRIGLRIFFLPFSKPTLNECRQKNDQVGGSHREAPDDRDRGPENRRATQVRSPEAGKIEKGCGEEKNHQSRASPRREAKPEDHDREKRRRDCIDGNVDMRVLDQELTVDVVSRPIDLGEVDRRLRGVSV